MLEKLMVYTEVSKAEKQQKGSTGASILHGHTEEERLGVWYLRIH